MDGFTIIIILLITLFIIIYMIPYVLLGIFLNKFNKLIYGKGTPMAFIPLTNIYLLGKLAVDKIVGWALVIFSFCTIFFSSTFELYNTMSYQLYEIILSAYTTMIIGLLIYCIIKYDKIKKSQIIYQQSLNKNTYNKN